MLYSQLDPDYIVTVNGSNIKSEDIVMWSVIDDEETSSAIVVELDNNDYRYSGKAAIGDILAIRFGYKGYLAGKAAFPILAYRELYTTGSGCTVVLEGRDPTQKEGGNKGRGNHKSKDPAEVAKSVVKDDLGGTPEIAKAQTKPKDEDGDDATITRMNESKTQLLAKLYPFFAKQIDLGDNTPSQDASLEEPPKEEGFQGEETKGDSHSGLGNAADANRGKHSGGQAGQDPVTATLSLVGYPQLKAKANVAITNVGDMASGTYYVKQCKHSISRGGGNFKTTASLIRGGIGKGSSAPINKLAPTVQYKDIYQDGGYLGPRKYNQAPQCTLNFGDGGPVISLEVTVSPQRSRGGSGAKGEGRGHDINKRLKPATSDDLGGTKE